MTRSKVKAPSAHSTTIAASDYVKIQASLQLHPAREDQEDQARLLQEKSKQRVSTWTNTLEGQRKKEAARKLKEIEDLEEARRQLDEQEAYFQLQQRREVVERANAILAREADRIKTFNSAMMLSDVLAEREAQVRLKTELTKLERLRDEKYQDVLKHNYRQMLARELKDKQEIEQKTREMATIQTHQLEQSKQRKLSEIMDDIEEGDLLRMKASEDLLLEQQLAQQKRLAAQSALLETQKSNEYLKELKQRELDWDAREDRRIAEYANHKELLLQKRQQKEKEIFEQKQTQRLKMIEAQALKLKQIHDQQESILNKQVAEKLAKDEQTAAAKLLKMQTLQSEINRSRDYQVKMKLQRKLVEMAKDKEEAETQKNIFEQLAKDQVHDLNLRKAVNLRLKQEQLQQIEMKNEQHQLNQDKEKRIVQRAKQAILKDVVNFHSFAEGVIKEYAEDGKNVIPMISELKKYKQTLHQ